MYLAGLGALFGLALGYLVWNIALRKAPEALRAVIIGALIPVTYNVLFVTDALSVSLVVRSLAEGASVGILAYVVFWLVDRQLD